MNHHNRLKPFFLAIIILINFNALAMSGLVTATQTKNLYTYRAVITSVYDGDTVTADIDLGMKIWLRGERLRLWGIDTPEINRGSNREMARMARDFLRAQILGRSVIIKTIKDRKGKYGRYLAIIYKKDVNINELMVTEAYAKRYMTRR